MTSVSKTTAVTEMLSSHRNYRKAMDAVSETEDRKAEAAKSAKQKEIQESERTARSESKRSPNPLVNPEDILRNVKLSFEIDKDTEEVVIKVFDQESGDLIRQIPPEEMLNLAKVFKAIKGSFVDQVT